jgi:hypothetical protein
LLAIACLDCSYARFEVSCWLGLNRPKLGNLGLRCGQKADTNFALQFGVSSLEHSMRNKLALAYSRRRHLGHANDQS